MRIALAHLRHAPSGGTERYLDGLARHLASRGHEVVVVCRSHARAPHPAVRFHELHGLALGGAWRMWGFARALERHVANERYDLVVGLGKTWAQDVLRLGGGCQRTYLELAHEATLTPRDRLLGGGNLKHSLAVRIEERALAQPGLHVIANSDMVRRDVLARYPIEPGRVSTIHNGVELARFHPRLRSEAGAAKRRELGLSSETLVLFLGTGYARKGLELVLEAFPAVLAARPEARLVVAGFDSAGPRYQARARELGIADATRFVGGTLSPETLYAAADLYVLPTYYDPFANSTLEALASGVPVITSLSNGGAELIDEGVHGARLDVRPDAGPRANVVATLAQHMTAWCEPERARAGGLAARARAEQHGDESKFAAAEALFERLAERRLAAAGGRP